MSVPPIPATGSLTGQVAVVTGATSGIGEATAAGLLARGARVVVVGRDPARLASSVDRLRVRVPSGSIETACHDLSLLRGVRELATEVAARHPRIDVLVNNAGALFAERRTTAEGHEMTWALNVLAPFLLTHLVREPLRASGAGRVVMVTSAAHRGARVDPDDLESARAYRGYRAYASSKLALILLTKEFARRWAGEPIFVNAVHPGFVASRFAQNNPGAYGGFFALAEALFGISPERGARRVVHVAADPPGGEVRGEYFSRGRRRRPDPAAEDAAMAARLWAACAAATGVGPNL